MTNNFFNNDEYHTPKSKKRVLGDRLTLNTSIYFNLRFLGTVLKNRKLAVKGLYNREIWASSSNEILKFLENCGGRFHISGFNNLNQVKKEPVVFISNHMSTLETMVFPGLIAPVKEVTFVVKEQLVKNKLFGPVIGARDPITVGRKDSRNDLLKVMSDGQKKLKKGTSVVIFPQSTRTYDFDPKKFNSLGVKLAAKAGVKIVPMAIKTDFWRNGILLKDIGRLKRDEDIYIKFGKPIEIIGNGKDAHQQVIHFIHENLSKWQNK